MAGAEQIGFDPESMLQVLVEYQVDFVVIGGMAAAMHGSDHVTTDLDITPDRDLANVERLSAALDILDARVRVAGIEGGLAFAHDGASLLRAGVWNLTTRYGDLDLSFVPTGTAGFGDLSSEAVVVDLDGTEIAVAALNDVIRSKEAADRPKDRLVLPSLRRLSEVIRGLPVVPPE